MKIQDPMAIAHSIGSFQAAVVAVTSESLVEAQLAGKELMPKGMERAKEEVGARELLIEVCRACLARLEKWSPK